MSVSSFVYLLSIKIGLLQAEMGWGALIKASVLVALLLSGAAVAILHQRGSSTRTKLISVSIILVLIAFIVLSLWMINRYYKSL